MRTKGGLNIMFEYTPQGIAFGFLDKRQLIKLRTKAMRSGVWFRALRRIDRTRYGLKQL